MHNKWEESELYTPYDGTCFPLAMQQYVPFGVRDTSHTGNAISLNGMLAATSIRRGNDSHRSIRQQYERQNPVSFRHNYQRWNTVVQNEKEPHHDVNRCSWKQWIRFVKNSIVLHARHFSLRSSTQLLFTSYTSISILYIYIQEKPHF